MQISDTTNKNGVIQNMESLCKLGDAGITGNSTLFSKMIGYVNLVNQQVATALMQCDERWQFDDYNNTDLPRATATLVFGQRDYTLPVAGVGLDASSLLGLVRVAVLLANGQEQPIVQTDRDESWLNNQYANSSLPFVYKLVGNSMKIWPAADNGVSVTLVGGLVCYFKRTPVAFTTASTTVQPGFLSSFHDVLQLGASAQYLLPIDNKLAIQYLTLYTARVELLQEATVRANGDYKNKIMTRRRSSR